MIRGLTISVLGLALLAGACAYESSGTTTTTIVDIGDLPPATGPADIVVEDQRVEGTLLIVESVTLPADGWVVVRMDAGGTPGEVIGVSEILRKGVISRVPVPFFVPITEDTVVHASIHVDVDRDGEFTYEAPDSLIDEIATFANGQVATTTATIELLPPLQPGEAILEDQRTDGTVVVGASAVLPSPGFVALVSNVEGAPGEVLAITQLLDAGAVDGLEFFPDPPLRVSGLVFLVVWVDRDEDGLFDPEFDDVAVRIDGTLAQVSATMQVVPLEPTSIAALDQEGDGASLVVTEVVLPSAGFIEVLSDVNGSPGVRLAISGIRVADSYHDVVVELGEPIADGTVLWVRVIIDFDEDGVAGPDDPIGLVTIGGDEASATFVYTIPEE